jgi:4'-phosphopantetheinyl transferase
MTVFVFLCRVLPDDGRHLATLLVRLDDAEQQRAARFVFDRDRRAYVAAHALLRRALDLQAGPRRWCFAVNAYGKPRLDPGCDDIRFSLSHTDDLVAVALTRGQDVGVDVEAATRDPDEAALVALALAPGEIADLDGFADRRSRLLQLWVAKEALAKAIGIGLSLPLQQVLLRGDPPCLAALPVGYSNVSNWWLRTTRQGEHWLGLATERAPTEVVLTEWTVADLVEDAAS